MSVERPLKDEYIVRVKAYESEVVSLFEKQFKDAADRFGDSQRLLDRFTEGVDSYLANPSPFRGVDEAHNELCIAAAILSNPNPKFSRLEYEPPLAACAKTIDFRATSDEGLTVFVDVKTIKPEPKDRWDQFERVTKEGWFPGNVKVILSKDALGGELWHNMYAPRERMLEHTIELEQKIADGGLKVDNTCFVLALCGDDFSWHEDELEDFVSFYFSGSHRLDDLFAKMETNHIYEEKITIAKSVSSFAFMCRSQLDTNYRRLNWNVQPPRFR